MQLSTCSFPKRQTPYPSWGSQHCDSGDGAQAPPTPTLPCGLAAKAVGTSLSAEDQQAPGLTTGSQALLRQGSRGPPRHSSIITAKKTHPQTGWCPGDLTFLPATVYVSSWGHRLRVKTDFPATLAAKVSRQGAQQGSQEKVQLLRDAHWQLA